MILNWKHWLFKKLTIENSKKEIGLTKNVKHSKININSNISVKYICVENLELSSIEV